MGVVLKVLTFANLKSPLEQTVVVCPKIMADNCKANCYTSFTNAYNKSLESTKLRVVTKATTTCGTWRQHDLINMCRTSTMLKHCTILQNEMSKKYLSHPKFSPLSLSLGVSFSVHNVAKKKAGWKCCEKNKHYLLNDEREREQEYIICYHCFVCEMHICRFAEKSQGLSDTLQHLQKSVVRSYWCRLVNSGVFLCRLKSEKFLVFAKVLAKNECSDDIKNLRHHCQEKFTNKQRPRVTTRSGTRPKKNIEQNKFTKTT